MKKLIKKIINEFNKKIYNLYLKYYYNNQISKKFLKKDDLMEKDYKNNVEKYWKNFNLKINYKWHKWYSSRNGIKDTRYIPEDIFYCYIEPYFNKVNFSEAYTDKALHSIWFSNVKKPKVIAKNMSGIYFDDNFKIMSFDEVVNVCLNKTSLIFKPTIESGGGKNIYFFDSKNELEPTKKIQKILIDFNQDFIIQEIIEQHDEIKQINPTSVNTIRTISFFWRGEVHILSSILRMGVNSSRLDNETSGGISCGINPNGKLSKFAYDRYGNKFLTHPSGFVFSNFEVPSYKSVIEIIKKEHIKFGHFNLISWDFAIDKDGFPILIEYNLKFQGLNFHQMDNGPLFGDLTDEILGIVFHNA